MNEIEFVDSHTAGEPTRIIVRGGPDLGHGTLSERLEVMRREFDHFRTLVILEPRGSEALVGGLLCEPAEPDCTAGVIFFNNIGYLGMCGHGMIGLATTLAHLGQARIGRCRIDTPVGVVEVELNTSNRVTINNIPAYRLHKAVEVDVPGLGVMRGDVAWGGNWFFLVDQTPYELTRDNIPRLSDAARTILRELPRQGVTGAEGMLIDHLEFFGPPRSADADSRNFVMCPGGAYDRSPCGTGTCAKLACLAADQKLAPGDIWIQEGILGSRFVGSYQPIGENRITPKITGEAYVTAQGRLILNEGDPFRHGIGANEVDE